MPEEIAKKINKDPNLFKEFKLFTCKMSISKSKSSSNNKNLWTFPEFKGTVKQRNNSKIVDINFPDPKFYMIGFTLSTPRTSSNLDASNYTSIEKDNTFSNSQMDSTLKNLESFHETSTIQQKTEIKRTKAIAQKNMTMKYKLRKDTKKKQANKPKNYIIFDKTTKLNASTVADTKNFKSTIDTNKTISEVNSYHLNSVDKANEKRHAISTQLYPSSVKNFKKKLSSGVVKKFDKALALTSRVARVSLDNKNQSAISGATGSSLSYSQGINISEDVTKRDFGNIPKGKPKLTINKTKYTSNATAQSIASKKKNTYYLAKKYGYSYMANQYKTGNNTSQLSSMSQSTPKKGNSMSGSKQPTKANIMQLIKKKEGDN